MKANPRLPIALIVTTDTETMFYLRKSLQLSFQLIEREGGRSAQDTLEYTSPDLIVFDSKDLKEEDLFLTLSRLRGSLGKKKTPILLITNNLKKKFAQDALRAGASDFINRPLDEDEIEQRIAVAFQSFEKNQNISTVAHRSTPQIPTTSASLSHRTFLNDQAIKEIGKARESGEYVSLLIIEVLLKEQDPSQCTIALEDNLRRNDILISQGPGKYILVLPKTSPKAAALIAKTIQENMEDKLFSISIGKIAWDSSQPSHGSAADEFDHLIKAASAAMLEAKKAGK